MQSSLLQSPPLKSYNTTTTAFPAQPAGAMANDTITHTPSGGDAAQDATSIIVVDADPKESTLSDFFTFDSPGGFTWWAGAVLGLLGCCAFASMIIIGVESSRRAPPAVMELMRTQQCPLLSSLLPPLAFEAWRSTCPRVSRGVAYACSSANDCVALGSRCADPNLLARLQCVQTGAAASASRKVCAYPAANTTVPVLSVASPGFCTAAGTSCAVCLSGSCSATTPSAGLIGCPSTSVCTGGGGWLCNPLSP